MTDVGTETTTTTIRTDDTKPVTPQPIAIQSINEILKDNPLYGSMMDIFRWKDVIQSGVLFSIGNLTFFLLTCGGYTAITLASYLFLVLMVTSYAWIQFHTLRSQPHPFDSFVEQVPRDHINAHVETVFRLWELERALVAKIFFLQDLQFSLKAAFLVFIASIIGKWFSGIFLLYCVFLYHFTWPRLYSEFQPYIDNGVAKALLILQAHIGPLVDKIPPLPIIGKIKLFKQE